MNKPEIEHVAKVRDNYNRETAHSKTVNLTVWTHNTNTDNPFIETDVNIHNVTSVKRETKRFKSEGFKCQTLTIETDSGPVTINLFSSITDEA